MRHYRVLLGLLLLANLLFLAGCEEMLCLLGLCPSPPEAAYIYAIKVRGFGICTANNNYCDPSKAEGPPDETSPWTGHFVSLGGRNGYIIATMSRRFTDGPGIDLRIYEVGRLQGGENEPFDVFISSDGTSWIQVADNIKNDPNKVYASIDIAPNTGNYLYIKVVDESTRRSTPKGTPGSDIDALEALWAATVTPSKFKPGDVVKVIDTGDSGLNVRDAPAGEVIKTVPDGWTFKIIGGPRSAALGGKTYTWWEVREEGYEPSPVKGWVAEDFIREISPDSLTPSSSLDYFIFAHQRVEQAIEWAKSKEGSTEWYDPETKMGYCLRFVSQAFGLGKNVNRETTGWGSPNDAIEKLGDRFYTANQSWNPPRGALVFFSGTGPFEPYGHIGIYLGNGEVIHAYGIVRIQQLGGDGGIEQLSYIGSYIGWAYPPREWLHFPSTCKVNPANGHLYCLTPKGLTWPEAESYAVGLGGHLVAVNDQQEQEWLVQTFGGDKWMWIGFTDSAEEGIWIWSNGDSVTYTNWYPGEPNDMWSCGEDYAVMNWESPGYWNDLGPCSPEWESVGIGIMEFP